MKLSTACFAVLGLLSNEANAFSSSPAFARTVTGGTSTSTSLNASRNRDKIATRSKWAESRGMTAVDESSAVAAGLMTNESGLEYVKLVNGDSSSEIYLYGGVVTSYIKDDVEYIAVRPGK